MRRLTALALVLVCLTPCAGLAQETVEADFEGGHWLYEDTAQGVRVEIARGMRIRKTACCGTRRTLSAGKIRRFGS